MREILFRGKHYRTGEWVYGVFFRNPVAGLSESAYYPQIMPEIHGMHSTVHSCSVIEETVGEFTGLTDKNGVKIFEGDIVKSVQDDLFVISWEDGQFMANNINDWLFAFEVAGKRGKIIGNIHDNPELLGGAK